MKTTNKHGLIIYTDDATDASGGPEGEVDPLAEAAGGVDTSFPVLMPDRKLRFECSSCVKAPSKTDPSRETLTITLKTTTDTSFQNGKPCRAGFKIFKRYGVTPTPPSGESDGRTIEAIKKDLSFVLKSFFGANTTVSARDLLNNPSMLEKRPVDGKTGIEKGSGGFPDKTSVTFIIPAS